MRKGIGSHLVGSLKATYEISSDSTSTEDTPANNTSFRHDVKLCCSQWLIKIFTSNFVVRGRRFSMILRSRYALPIAGNYLTKW